MNGDTTNALVPTSEAAAPSSTHGTAYPHPRRGHFGPLSRRSLNTLRGTVTAASVLLSALLDRVAAFCRDTFGTIELTIGWFCANCDDVHEDGVECPRLMIGQCAECVDVVDLTPAGNCPVSQYHLVCNRSAKAPSRKAMKT